MKKILPSVAAVHFEYGEKSYFAEVIFIGEERVLTTYLRFEEPPWHLVSSTFGRLLLVECRAIRHFRSCRLPTDVEHQKLRVLYPARVKDTLAA